MFKPMIPERVDNKVPPAKPDKFKDLSPQATLKDQIALVLADNADKVEMVGVAIKTYSAKYDGWIKTIMMALGYAVEYAGKELDKRVMRAKDLK